MKIRFPRRRATRCWQTRCKPQKPKAPFNRDGLRRRPCGGRCADRRRSVRRTRHRLGAHAGLPPPPPRPGLRHRRGDGYLAARHGPRLAQRAGADRAARSPMPGPRRRHDLFRLRHRPAATPMRETLDDVVRAYLDQVHAIQKLGGRIILMASRALVSVAKTPGRLCEGLFPRAGGGRPSRDPALAGRDVRPRAERLLGQRRLQAGAGDLPCGDQCQCGEGRRHQDLASRRREGDRHAAAAAASVKMYTGDDFNYPGADRR